MSEPTPLSQLLSNTNNGRITSIRGVQQKQAKLIFAPNVNAAGATPMPEKKEEEERTKIKVRKEPKIKKPVAKRTIKHKQTITLVGPSSNETRTNAVELEEETKKEKKTLLLNPDLDFDPCNPNHPITLPLKDPENESKDQNEEEIVHQLDKEKTYYTPLETIEENPTYINNPLHTENGLLTDEYIMMQIPSVLPIKNAQKIEEEKKETDGKTESEEKVDSVENPLNGKSGYIGTIQIRKSGIATIQIGGVTFRLTKGAKPHFLEEAAVVSIPKRSVYRLGTISQHVVMTPELDSCLNDM